MEVHKVANSAFDTSPGHEAHPGLEYFFDFFNAPPLLKFNLTAVPNPEPLTLPA